MGKYRTQLSTKRAGKSAKAEAPAALVHPALPPIDPAAMLLTFAQAARLLGVSERWVADATRLGRLPRVALSPKEIRIRRADLATLIETAASGEAKP